MTALDERAPMSSSTARSPAAGTALSIELRHLRYFVALADAGSFTHAAQRIFIAQPTLSQQIRRLEEIVGTPLLQRRREGLRLTAAGRVLLDASRNVLALSSRVSRTRRAAGLGRQRLRWRYHPTCRVHGSRGAAGCGRQPWPPGGRGLARTLDAEFSLVGTRRADLRPGGWRRPDRNVAVPLDAMVLGEFDQRYGYRPTRGGPWHRISLEELASMDVIPGRAARIGTYDAWTGRCRRLIRGSGSPIRRSGPPCR
jgi:hypothetical protein